MLSLIQLLPQVVVDVCWIELVHVCLIWSVNPDERVGQRQGFDILDVLADDVKDELRSCVYYVLGEDGHLACHLILELQVEG